MHKYQIDAFLWKNVMLPPIYYMVALVVGSIVYLLSKRITKKEKPSIVLGIITAFLFALLSTTVLVRIPKADYSYELMPLWSYVQILNGELGLLIENALNILMLMPVGVLLAVGFAIRKKHVVITGVIISLTIEILQLVTRRGLFEFDDILHNSIGCLIGYVVCRCFRDKVINKL